MPQAALTQASLLGSDREKVHQARDAISRAFARKAEWTDRDLIEAVASELEMKPEIVEYATYELRSQQVIQHNDRQLLQRQD
jgi:hypothetical protein